MGEGQEEIDMNYREFELFDEQATLEAEKSDTTGLTQDHSIWMELEGGKPGHKKTIL